MLRVFRFFIVCIICYSWTNSQASIKLEALEYIHKSEYQKAADLLEKAFLKETLDSEAVDFAELLVTLENIKWTQPRHYYAAYLLDHPHQDRSVIQKMTFLQIAMDGYFTVGDFKRAERFVKEAISLTEAPTSYKTAMKYQLAWIYVNKNQTPEGIQTLRQSLNEDKKSPFREKMIFDLGMFEGELTAHNPKRAVEVYPEVQENVSIFSKGFFKGLNRWKTQDHPELLNQINHPELRNLVAKNYGLQPLGKKSNACAQLKWFPSFQITPTDEPQALEILKSCQADPKVNQKLLLTAYSQIPTISLDLYPYAELLKKSGSKDKACFLIENLFALAKPETTVKNTLFSELVSECSSFLTQEKIQLYSTLALEDKMVHIPQNQKIQQLKDLLKTNPDARLFSNWNLIGNTVLADATLSYKFYLRFSEAKTPVSEIALNELQIFKNNIDLLEACFKGTCDSKILKAYFLIETLHLPAFLKDKQSMNDLNTIQWLLEINNNESISPNRDDKQDPLNLVKTDLLKIQKLKKVISLKSRKSHLPLTQKLLQSFWKNQLEKVEIRLSLFEKQIDPGLFNELKTLIHSWRIHV